jgi:oligoribonuclease NrnB/cAMP/cGMP phosphodiesterase (DHH superfamily)
MKPLVIYHGNCADGFSAAWCFWKKYGDGADYYPGVYQKNPPDCSGRDVYLVDFSYKPEVVEILLREARSVTLIDHHKTAIEGLRPIKEAMSATNNNGMGDNFGWYCDLNRSGATLAWDYLFPGEPRPLLLGHIEDRDLWRFKLSGTREIQANVFSYEYTFEQWDKLMSADGPELLRMTAAGAAIERKHWKDLRELLAVCRRTMAIGGHVVPVAGLPYTMVSDAAHEMAKGVPFAACYWDTPETRNFGLRSDDNGLDVSAVAALYGGGGHLRSAGFSVPRNHDLAQS